MLQPIVERVRRRTPKVAVKVNDGVEKMRGDGLGLHAPLVQGPQRGHPSSEAVGGTGALDQCIGNRFIVPFSLNLELGEANVTVGAVDGRRPFEVLSCVGGARRTQAVEGCLDVEFGRQLFGS